MAAQFSELNNVAIDSFEDFEDLTLALLPELQQVEQETASQMAVTDPQALEAKLREILPRMSDLGITGLLQDLVDLDYTVKDLEALGLSHQQPYLKLKERILKGPTTSFTATIGLKMAKLVEEFFPESMHCKGIPEEENKLPDKENKRSVMARGIDSLLKYGGMFIAFIGRLGKLIARYVKTRSSKVYEIAIKCIDLLIRGIFGGCAGKGLMSKAGYEHMD